MPETHIDVPRLFGALDERVKSDEISWRTAAAQIGVSPSLLSRMRNNHRPDLDGFVMIVKWLGRSADDFVGNDTAVAVPVAVEDRVRAVLRASPDLSADDKSHLEDLFVAAIAQVRSQTKAALGRLAAEVRAELELDDDIAFDPWAWAKLWGVPFLALDEVENAPAAVRHFTEAATASWSAALIQDGFGQLVIFNSAHSPARIRSNLAHEVAHIVAEHELNAAWMGEENGCGGARPKDEKEAAELAGALLIPAAAAKAHAIYDRSAGALAARYGVSEPMARWRMRESGGTVIRQRIFSKRGGGL
jgi:hypothetical protein